MFLLLIFDWLEKYHRPQVRENDDLVKYDAVD